MRFRSASVVSTDAPPPPKKKKEKEREQKKAKYANIKHGKSKLALSCLIIYILFHPLKKPTS